MWCQIYSTFQPFILSYHNYCMIFILKGPRQWQYLISLHLGAMQYDKGWCNWHHLLTKFVHQFMVSTHWSVSLNCAFGNVWCTMYPIRYGPYRNSGAQEYGIWTNTANIHPLSMVIIMWLSSGGCKFFNENSVVKYLHISQSLLAIPWRFPLLRRKKCRNGEKKWVQLHKIERGDSFIRGKIPF